MYFQTGLIRYFVLLLRFVWTVWTVGIFLYCVVWLCDAVQFCSFLMFLGFVWTVWMVWTVSTFCIDPYNFLDCFDCLYRLDVCIGSWKPWTFFIVIASWIGLDFLYFLVCLSCWIVLVLVGLSGLVFLAS